MKRFSCNQAAAILLCVLVVMSRNALAGAVPPCIQATLSANASILVVNEITYTTQDQGRPQQVQSSTFRVFGQYVDLNQGLRMNGPNTNWANPIWSVVLTNKDQEHMVSCSYTLVTDDGEYLILLQAAFGHRDILSIYRRRDHPGHPSGGSGLDHGVLVRHIPLTAFWELEQIPQFFTDHTPMWFANGTFAFSADNRMLTHTTRWGRTFQIRLETGELVKNSTER